MKKPISDMTAKDYLSQAYRIDMRINAKLEQVSNLRVLATKACGTLTDMPRSDSPNLQSMESIVVKLVDMEREINTDIDTLIDLKREVAADHFPGEPEVSNGAGASLPVLPSLARNHRHNGL